MVKTAASLTKTWPASRFPNSAHYWEPYHSSTTMYLCFAGSEPEKRDLNLVEQLAELSADAFEQSVEQVDLSRSWSLFPVCMTRT